MTYARNRSVKSINQLTVSNTGVGVGFAITARASPATNIDDDAFASTIIDVTAATASFGLDLPLIRHIYPIFWSILHFIGENC